MAGSAPYYQPLKTSDEPEPSTSRSQAAGPHSNRRLSRRFCTVLGLFIAALLLFASPVFKSSRRHITSDFYYESVDELLQQCVAPVPPIPTPPAPRNIWASLTVDETVAIQHWLEAPERGLNLTRADKSELSDNLIYLIETYYPPKDAALAYIDNPTSVSPPDRYARVTIHHGSDELVKDYLVGPLPISSATTIRHLTEIYHRDTIPFNARGYVTVDDYSRELFGGSIRGLANDTLIAAVSAPFSFDGTFHRTWITWYKNAAGSWLLPVGFWQYVDMTGTDTATWRVLKIVYNHQAFNSTEAFLEALHAGVLVRMPWRDPNEDVSWTSRRRPSVDRDLDDLPGPRSVSFAGLRFRVNKALQYVTWMGWSLYLGFDRDMGLSLWDIRIKGERIIYQLAPQEAIAQYSGNDPYQQTTVWLDRHFGMGDSVRDMLPGYDCPHEAVFLPATTYSSLGSIIRERAICIFEQDSGKPITRHTGYMESEFGAVKGYVLTIRSISTVGNYDYCAYFLDTFDYLFYMDGTMEVKISASGYLQGTFWEPQQNAYGGRIHDFSMGSVHDHVMSYKVDLDVVGVRNSLLQTTTAQEEVTVPWYDDEWGPTVLQQRITKSYIDNEDNAKLRWPANFQGGYSIVNKEALNQWGYPRGYAIHPGLSPIYNTVVGSKRLLKNAQWAFYNLAVSRRKETEPSSSNMWNANLPAAPVVDFDKFFDGESLDQEDLVAWVSVGMHHLPQAEDSPNTKTNVATTSFLLLPLNYFDYDISMESKNAIVLNMPTEEDGAFTYDDYGVNLEYTCVPHTPPRFQYTPHQTFDADGKLRLGTSLEDIRKAAEGYHRIKLGL
ncbi:amine oxidase catalytic domain-containing protein [Fistulina hepatica ATCC 64428]|uniref:Amine oxidase n=1 Tax=Fistulina hepatica ATCC 64428 TaxID=1128425 RepID=A0A0D6ZZZ8_9AGAR|nr:amine oxidase catalytic domain-containing protein [Fistulina hepatica ATCC 64428]